MANYKGNESRRKTHARAGVGQWRAYPACQPLRKNIPDAYLTDKVLDVTCERCLADLDKEATAAHFAAHPFTEKDRGLAPQTDAPIHVPALTALDLLAEAVRQLWPMISECSESAIESEWVRILEGALGLNAGRAPLAAQEDGLE